jgi:hypothetical protein
MKLLTRTFSVVCFLFLFLSGCAKPTIQTIAPSEAEKTFIRICKDDYQQDVLTKQTGETLWIYVPVKFPLVDYKSTDPMFTSFMSQLKKFSVQFIDGKFEAGTINVDYDISPSKTYSKDRGFTSIYTEEFKKAQRDLYTAIYRSFADSASTPDRKAPQFFVIVLADIVKGLEFESIVYWQDLNRAFSNPPDLTQEEYAKRYVSDLRGNTNIVGDTTGTHLQYRDITFGEFLTKQIINRINFKFQQSDFTPTDNITDEIITIIRETTQAYQFSGFQTIKLHNLVDDSSYVLEADKL